MRSAIFAGAGRPLALQERPIPVPAAGQALIRIERCGICGSDLHMTSGGVFDLPQGSALGHEYAGEVVALGPGDARLCVGDRVTALPMSGCGHCPACLAGTPLYCAKLQLMMGGYGDYTLIDQRLAMRLPSSLSFQDGALVEPLASGLRGMQRLALHSQVRVAVIGMGAIGAACVYWAHFFGARRIAAIARSARGKDLALTVGASAFVSTGEGLAARLTEALGGAPDIVVEAAGARGTLQQAIELVQPGGAVLSLGGCSVPDTIVPIVAMTKEIRVVFSSAYAVADFHKAIDTLDAGFVSPRSMVGETISLSALPARFEAMRGGGHPAKVMVAPGLS
jgi:(R,R)-butanediol dehydrogenase/meso-butanediol dehydrogenase/diacetyl reductase